MATSAFARCQAFLNYHPLAKWFSIVSSVSTALLYVALILLLGLFIDLTVERGEIPSYHQLPEHERRAFLGEMLTLADDKDGREAFLEELKTLGFDAAQVKGWAHAEPIEKWSPREPALLWWVEVHRLLTAKVGPDA